jgi:hypothetical protein
MSLGKGLQTKPRKQNIRNIITAHIKATRKILILCMDQLTLSLNYRDLKNVEDVG